MRRAPVTVPTRFIATRGKADRSGPALLIRVRPRTAGVQRFYSRPHRFIITWEQNKETVPRVPDGVIILDFLTLLDPASEALSFELLFP